MSVNENNKRHNSDTCTCYIYIYIYIYILEISGKVNEPNTFNGFSSDILFFIQGRTSSE